MSMTNMRQYDIYFVKMSYKSITSNHVFAIINSYTVSTDDYFCIGKQYFAKRISDMLIYLWR